jgi:replicative DNA helicase
VTVLDDTSVLLEAAPPHDIKAEQATLGAMMLSPAVADEISEVVLAEDFYRPIHSDVYRAIVELAGRGERPDPIAVAKQLGDDLGRIGGAPYLHTLIETPPTVANGGYYAKIVAELATRRRIGEAGVAITSIARSPDPIAEVRDRAAQTAFDATTDRRESASITPVSELVGPVMEHIEAISQGRIDPGIPTGLKDLDAVIGGMYPGQLIIPAGRTSMGKSVVTQNWVHNAVRHTGRPGILFSVEMSKDEMMQRLLSEVAGVDLTKIREGKLTDADWTNLVAAEGYISELPLHLVDNVRTVPGIRAAARRFRHRVGDLVIVGVDYLQRLQGLDRRRDRHEEVGGFADALKDLAQDMAIPVVAPCQLNRGPENRTGKGANKPRLADLRESGNLEQTADVVALLYRAEYYDKTTTNAGTAEIDVAKNRNGPTETVKVAARLNVQKFSDLARLTLEPS